MSGLIDLIQFNVVTLGAAVLIGVAAARWLFRRPPAPEQRSEEPRSS